MPRPKMKRILASTICSTELMPDKIAIVRNHPAPRRMRKTIGTRGACAAGCADPLGGAPPGLSDILVLLRREWTFAENHLAMQRRTTGPSMRSAVRNQQVAIEEIGAACPQPASRICKPNSP